jgi:hypothetical protein
MSKWAQHQRSSGPVQRSIPGWAARRSGVQRARRPHVIFATQRNGQSGVAKLSGETKLDEARVIIREHGEADRAAVHPEDAALSTPS